MSWIENTIFYNIYPLGFCGAPEYNDGVMVPRLDYINQWIPHLKELGVNAVVFNPVFESTKHGYDTKDYYKIDCRLGNNESFKIICSTLHENGIKVILDGVFNHVGREFFAFADVKMNREKSKYTGWFHHVNFSSGSPKGDPFTYEGWSGHYDLVKLNLQNRDVVDYLLGAVELWIKEFEIDGLRLDAADCIDASFFKELRNFCKARKSDFWLYGEIIHGDYNRWANPDMLDSVTNYECYKGLYSSHNDHNYFEIAHSLQRQFGSGGIYKNIYTFNFADNHDVNRIGSVVRDKALLKNIHTLLYAMPGAPSLYYGSEWGIEGIRTDQSDAGLRPHLDINQIPNPDYGLLDHLKKLGKLRNHLSALKNGTFENVLIRNEQLVIKRKNENRTVYAAFNISDTEAWLNFPVDEACILTDVLDGNTSYSCGSQANIPVPPYGSRILVPGSGITDLEREQAESELTSEIYEGKDADVSDGIIKQNDVCEILPVRIGRYRHFKGKEYEVIGIAKHSETLEDMVVYRALYGEFGLWVRPYSMFCETVEANGRKVMRFTRT